MDQMPALPPSAETTAGDTICNINHRNLAGTTFLLAMEILHG
jgi:hypothetical protein